MREKHSHIILLPFEQNKKQIEMYKHYKHHSKNICTHQGASELRPAGFLTMIDYFK